MSINTGELIHDIRNDNIGTTAYKVGDFAAKKLSLIKSVLRPVLGIASLAQSIIGNNAVNSMGKNLHKCGFPLWTSAMPDRKSVV